jgi:hypothetical protein
MENAELTAEQREIVDQLAARHSSVQVGQPADDGSVKITLMTTCEYKGQRYHRVSGLGECPGCEGSGVVPDWLYPPIRISSRGGIQTAAVVTSSRVDQMAFNLATNTVPPPAAGPPAHGIEDFPEETREEHRQWARELLAVAGVETWMPDA